MIRIDGLSWSEYCESIGADCVQGYYNATCRCHNGSKFENDSCRETCEVIRDDGISWWEYCASLNASCLITDEFATCVCPYGFTFLNGSCISKKRNNCWKNCLNGGNCTLRAGRQICKCPIEFWGENCEKVNFCKIHHQDGLSGEDYCERGDAKCLNDDSLNCHCYNPHRYFDYESGTCINPCTTWPCRNGGTCMFNENRNSTCLCTPYFTGNRCEYVNWCKVKRISGKSAEDYCLAYGAHCEMTGSGRVGCHCNTNYSEFDYSLRACIKIDMCAINRKGFQVCSQKNAICKNDRFAKSGSRYTCECPPETVLENGICKKRNACEKGEKGHEICNLLNAECKLNSSISNGFECKCSLEYAPNNYGRCIDTKICYEGHQGFSDCNRRDAVCLHNFDNEIGYQCECRPGYKKSKIGKCNEITECDEGEVGFLECNIKNAVCVRDVSRYKRYFCVCPENYATDRSGRCLKKYHGNKKNNEINIISDNDPCQKGNVGYEKCLKENAICIVSTKSNSFSCHCRPKQRKNSNETCTDLNVCEHGELGYKESTLLSVKCVKVASLQKGYECKCTEGETVDPSGRCIKL
ncbi:neurogenic locus notch homolog protein 1-like [Centruroides sculpturatus]|uniref:neurogenic locus notch homolog protein 1-like n=1 Tax=Centruroides sculpturatus TaxID=218467 RepID=UPI000C6D46C2|nr:neurogenic locus notch homolog protein 1-like [Centruroides sculpturatus]